jgi:thymidylate synthase (FAD)
LKKSITIAQGFINLESYHADDLSVVNAARVSLGKHSSEMTEGDKKLISFLMKERHGTPFEHNYFKFHVKCPIFVAREWFRHRISSFNEMSMRYHQPEIEFFLPSSSDIRTQVGKPGNYHFEKFEDEGKAEFWLKLINEHCTQGKELYELAIEMGIAKEQARIILPVNVYTEFYWSINARSLMNFLSLRNNDQAMKEIRDYAVVLEKFFKSKMPITYEAFINCNRVAV